MTREERVVISRTNTPCISGQALNTVSEHLARHVLLSPMPEADGMGNPQERRRQREKHAPRTLSKATGEFYHRPKVHVLELFMRCLPLDVRKGFALRLRVRQPSSRRQHKRPTTRVPAGAAVQPVATSLTPCFSASNVRPSLLTMKRPLYQMPSGVQATQLRRISFHLGEICSACKNEYLRSAQFF